MPDFNKGDFTQQGIANKVTLKARLNERRQVTLNLQSDVEEPNLIVSGNVHDELNTLDFPIGSAPSGNIEITENGENINVAPYATATVNVPAPAPEKHYVIPEGTYSSVDTMGMLAIPFLNLYFYAPTLYVNFDGNQYILHPSDNNIGTNGGVLYSNDLLTIFVTPDYQGLGLYSGTVILPGDTVPTPHTISAYYLGDERYWQCVHPLNFNELYVWANTYSAGETDMTFVMERPSQGDYSKAIYRAVTKEQGGIQIGRFYGSSFIVNNMSVSVDSVIGATRTGTKYYITNTGNLVYVNLLLPQ